MADRGHGGCSQATAPLAGWIASDRGQGCEEGRGRLGDVMQATYAIWHGARTTVASPMASSTFSY